MTQACVGLTVLDFGQGYGAIPGMILADYGAEVIKVEPPGGERFRQMPAFLQWNRGKKGVALDLKSNEGISSVHDLARRSDVVIENFRPGVAERLGIGYGDLEALNPALVYLSISGFGREGKYRDIKAYEGVVSAICGQAMLQNGYRQEGPIFDATYKHAFGASMLGFIGLMAAIHVKQETGAGQKVEMTLAQANFVYSYTGMRVDGKRLAPSMGRDPHNRSAGYRIAQTKDGKWIQSGSAGASIFENLMKALGIKEYFDDPRYRQPGALQNPELRDPLIELIDASYKQHTFDEWLKILDKNDAAYGVFMSTQEFMDYPQVRHNGHVVQVTDPTVGAIEQVGRIARFAGESEPKLTSAPRLGEHNTEVLTRLAAGPANGQKATGRVTLPQGALDGITIIDLAMWAAAPGGPGLLADLGARVIKVEPPSGDPLGGPKPGELFLRINRSKQRTVIDLKTPEGREVVHRLVAGADAFVHNFRPGVPERLGIDFKTLVAINPKLVYLYAASFGSSGPDAHRPAFDAVMSAMAGGEVLQAGEGNPPQMRQTSDHSALLGVAVALLLGIRARDITGQAQNVETTMLASAAYLFSDDFLRYKGKPDRPIPDQGQHGLHALYRLYQTKGGGWVFLACETHDEWKRFCESAQRPSLIADPRFSEQAQRARNDGELIEVLEKLFLTDTAEEWERRMLSHDVACVVATQTWGDYLFSEGFGGQRDFVTSFSHPALGKVDQSGQAVNLLRTPANLGVLQEPAAATATLLKELGYSPTEIKSLAEKKAVVLAKD